jgi:hypothetical protein
MKGFESGQGLVFRPRRLSEVFRVNGAFWPGLDGVFAGAGLPRACLMTSTIRSFEMDSEKALGALNSLRPFSTF